MHEVRLRDGSTVMAADQAPRDVRRSDVKWVTPRTYRLWRDTGLLGYDISGQPDPSWRGRNDGRNAAFTDLLFSSGLRLREGGCLLTLEVPEAAAGHCYYEGSVAGAVAKRRERMFYAAAAALRRVAGYIATTRAEAIRRARRHRRYHQMPGKLVVTKVSHGARRKLCWRDEQGRAGEAQVGAIGPAERMRLFTETEHGLEPLWLWLTEAGMPMAYPSWEKVFDAANARVAAVFAAATRQDGRRRTAIACSPHMMRHSFALYMLVALHHLPAQADGLILDLACGAGSPALEAARRNPGARVLGVDRAERLIDAARALAAAHRVGNASFEVMSLDALTLPDESVDAAISQFAFLQEGDVAVAVKELSRVLKDGAPFSVAAWDMMELNTLFSSSALALRRHVPAELLPDFGYLTELAAPGLRERLLREAGISALHTEMFSWQAPMPSPAAVWAVISAPVPFGRAADSLAGNQLALVRSELEQATAGFRAADGSYTFPMACRLFWGSK